MPQETDLSYIASDCVAIVSRRDELLYFSVSAHFYNTPTDPINFHVPHPQKQYRVIFLFHYLKCLFQFKQFRGKALPNHYCFLDWDVIKAPDFMMNYRFQPPMFKDGPKGIFYQFFLSFSPVLSMRSKFPNAEWIF